MTEREKYIVRCFSEAPEDHKSRAIGEAADDLNMSAVDVMKILENNGITFPLRKEINMKKAKHVEWTPELDARLTDLRSEGLKWADIGERIGISEKAASLRFYKLKKPAHIPAAQPEPKAMLPEAESETDIKAEADQDKISEIESPTSLGIQFNALFNELLAAADNAKIKAYKYSLTIDPDVVSLDAEGLRAELHIKRYRDGDDDE